MAKAPKTKQARTDGWRNIYTGLGSASRDKRLGATFTPQRLDESECEDLWLGDDIAACIIEAQPEAELGQGFDLVISDPTAAPRPGPPVRMDLADGRKADEGLTKDLNAYFEEKCLAMHLQTAREYARAYGGGALLVGAQDGQAFDQPLNEGNIATIPWVKVLRPRECWPASYYNSAKSAKTEKFGEVKTYRVMRDTLGGGSSQVLDVHESRIIPFYGVVVSTRQRAARNSWGDSVLNRVVEKVSDYQASFQAAGILVQDFAQAVFKMAGLAELMAQGDDGEQIILNRSRAIDMSRSVARAMLIDSEEEFERKATPVTGLSDLLDRFSIRIAAAARMPVTVMMGQSPAGLNATGASDIRIWYDQVKRDRTKHLVPKANRLVRLFMLAADSPAKGKEPKRWTLTFPSLWQMTDSEEADLRNKQADTDKKYIDAGVLLPEEVAVSRFGGDKWTMETQLDKSARDAATMAINNPEPAPGTEPTPGDPNATAPAPKPPPEKKAKAP